MARPIKQGLDYFPLDVDIDQDDKFAMIEAVHGHVGFSVVVRLLAKIYKEGYCYEWSKREQILFAKRVNVDGNTLTDIVNACMDERIFNKGIFEAHGVLTSKGIQKRYLEAVKRRKQVVFQKSLFLIDDVPGIIGSNKIEVIIEDGEQKVNVNTNQDSTDVDGATKAVKAPRKKAAPKAAAAKVVKYTPEDMEMAKEFFGLIQENNPDAREPNFDKWADDFRLLRTGKKNLRDPKATRFIMEWAQNDGFWKNNILSPSKLTAQWSKLAGIIRTEHEKKKNQQLIGQTNNGDKWEALDVE